MTNPTTRTIDDLARDAAAVAEQLGAGLEVTGWVGGEWFDASTGADLRPGSITKIVTTTAVLQLVEEGLVALDDAVARWVPHIRSDVAIWHLLTHSSGIDACDLFVDTGDGDDAIEKYVALLDGVGSVFEPGEACSYNNAGMVLAGRIVELVRGATYHDAVREHVFERAEMTTARFELENTDNPICSRGLAPAGSTLVCRPRDLVQLAISPDLLKPDTVAQMRTLQVAAPGGVHQNAGFGLGWLIWRNEHGEAVRHSGAYPGQSAALFVDESRDAVLAVMSPFGTGINGVNAMLDDRGAAVTDEPPASLDRYLGRFEAQTMSIQIQRRDDGGLQLQLGEFPAMPIEPVDRGCFTLVGEPFGFFGFDETGSPRFMRFRMRVQRRVS